MKVTAMAQALAWAIFALGIGHMVFGLVRYRRPLLDAVAAGFIGRFDGSDARRAAFWFLMCGLLLMLAGQVAIRSVAAGDLALLRIVGGYALISGALGVAAFPRSPFWLLLVLAPLLLGTANG